MKTTILFISLFCSFLVPISDNTDKTNLKTVSYKGNSMTVITIDPNSIEFGVKRRNQVNDDFFMNANFFNKSGKEIGEVVINGKTINERTESGGFFYVKNGKPGISLYSRPKGVQFSVQTKYVGINNGVINKRIVDTKVNSQGACRTILGKNKKGQIILIHSDRTSSVSMREISEFAITQGMINGILFDGGSSVDIGIKTNKLNYSFKSVPSFAKPFMGIDEPPIYIVGNEKNN